LPDGNVMMLDEFD